MFIHHSSFRDVYHYQLACSRGEQERMKELSESEVLHHRDSTPYEQWVLLIGNLLNGAKWFPADQMKLTYHIIDTIKIIT